MNLVFLSTSLFSSEWGRGSLASIGSLKELITIGAVFIISLIGFIIVVASICKLSINGLYCTFSKFWDKVYDAKMEAEGNFSAMTGKDTGVVKRAQSIGKMLLCLFPNVKACSEFEDGTGNAVPLDSKTFFARAIPATVFAIFIGYFTFAGYPLKVAEKFSTVGGEVIDIVLVNIDPISTAKSLFHTFERPDYTTNGSKDPYYMGVNKITQSVYTSYVGMFKDVKSDNRKVLGLELEKWVMTNLDAYENLFADGAHEYSYESIVTTVKPDLSRVNMDSPNADGVQTVAFMEECGRWSTGSAIDASEKWVVFKVTFTPIASAKVVTTVASTMTTSGSVTDNKYVISVSSSDNAKFKTRTNGYASCTYKNKSVAIAVEDGKLTFDEAVSGTVDVSNLYYFVDGVMHPIKKITIDSTVTIPKFNATDTALNVPEWTFGNVPVISKQFDTTSVDNSQSGAASGNGNNSSPVPTGL